LSITRRRLLLLIAGGATTAGALAAYVRRRRRAWTKPRLPEGEPGPLSLAALEAILAVPEALVDRAVERGHYERFYRFRAESLRGYRTLYERFAADTDEAAQRLFPNQRFHELSFAQRRAVLDELRIPHDRREDPRSFLHPWPPRYHRFIVGETLRLYDRTDAWIALGYGVWPGMPRTIGFMQIPPEELSAGAGAP
jgi:hypothetical protein